jgi:hypothetical protein
LVSDEHVAVQESALASSSSSDIERKFWWKEGEEDYCSCYCPRSRVQTFGSRTTFAAT